MRAHSNADFRIATLHNQRCKAKNAADVEFTSKSGRRWVIEAKSDRSGDRHNTAHKIFGELLKETGRAHRRGCRYALLIPKGAIGFYARKFRAIKRSAFVRFGKLIPVHTVFACDRARVKRLTWEQLYDAG
jgi:hypothetical protein